MPRLQDVLVTALLLAPALAQARELASGPEIGAIGFSRDGRLFAYEQFQDDEVSATVIAAIDVITRDGASSAKGFPFGFLGTSKNGEFPLRVGGHKIKLSNDDNVSGAKKLAMLRAAIRKRTATLLKTLGIVQPGTNLLGPNLLGKTCGASDHRPHRKHWRHRVRAEPDVVWSRAGYAAGLSRLGAVCARQSGKLRQRPEVRGSHHYAADRRTRSPEQRREGNRQDRAHLAGGRE
jgi:hypothetical protein